MNIDTLVNVTVRLSTEKNRLFNINTAADGITKQAVLEKAVDVFNQMHAEDHIFAKKQESYLDPEVHEIGKPMKGDNHTDGDHP